MNYINLNGEWKLSRNDSNEIISATVPGCNFTDLLAANAIPDPFLACYEKSVQWVGEKIWSFERTFEVSADDFAKGKQELVFEMLDTLSEVYLNGESLGKTQNAYRTYVFDVKGVLKEGENSVKVVFFSPLDYIRQWHKAMPLPNTTEGEAGSCHIRKPAYHFGWDWAPHLLHCGIMKPAYVRCYDGARLDGAKIVQTHENGKVTLSVTPELTDGDDAVVGYRLTCPDGREMTAAGSKTVSFEIEDPQLWWTADLGKQPLYKLECVLGKQVKTYRIGLRTLVLDRSKDEYGENFRFVLNGVGIFARGANWVPPDSFVSRTTRADLTRILTSARNANMNMLRAWGGGYYESDDFYDICDELGILVWQDCMFACSPYPYTRKDFVQEVMCEIEDNVRRIRHHASLALWCGNNELEQMSGAWMTRPDIIAQAGDFFYKDLPEKINSLDGITPYHASSPSGNAYMTNYNDDNYGDCHLWKVWHGMRPSDYLAKRNPRFCSEFGLQSLPHANTLTRMNGGSLPPSLKDPVMQAHQKAPYGNQRTLFYIVDRFRSPANLDDLIYLTQLSQAYCARVATENWRSKKGRCNGSLYWQLNDCWGVTSWSGYDYYGNPKAVHYEAKRFNAPRTVAILSEGDKRVVTVINDTLEDGDFEITYGLVTFKGDTVYEQTRPVSLKAGETKKIAAIKPREHGHKGKTVVFAKLNDKNGNTLASRWHTAEKEKSCSLSDPCLSAATSLAGDVYRIEISAKAYARGVEVALKGIDVEFSDNFVDLPAGGKAVITAPAKGLDKKTLDDALKIRSLYDVTPKQSVISDFFTAAKVFLKPYNFANWVYRTKE